VNHIQWTSFIKSSFRYFYYSSLFVLFNITLVQASDIPKLIQKLERDTSVSQQLDTHLKLISLYSNVDIDSSVFYFKEAEALAMKGKDFESLQKLFRPLVRVLMDKARYVEAKNYIDHAFVLAHQNDKAIFLGNLLRIKGDWHWEMSNLEEAFKNYQEALAISEDLNDLSLKASTLLSFGLLYGDTNEKEKQIEVEEEALKIFREIKDSSGQTVILNNIGYNYILQNDYENALIYLEEGLRIGEKIKYKNPAVYELSSAMKGEVLFKLGDKNLGYSILKKALTSAENNNHLRNQIIFNTIYAKSLFLDKEYKKAIIHANRGVKISHETNNLREIRELCDILIKCYKSLNDFEAALRWVNEKNKVIGELTKREKKEEIAKQEAKYKIEQIDLDNQMLVLTNKNQKNIIALILAFLVVITISLVYNHIKKQERQLEQFRQRIAADLHDDVGSKLNRIIRIAKSLQKDNAQEDIPKVDVQNLIKESHASVQNVVDVIWVLDQEESELDYLIEKMEEYLGRIKASHDDVNFSFVNENVNPRFFLSMKMKHHLLKTFQETIDFVLSYKRPQNIKIELLERKQSLRLSVENHFVSSVPEFKKSSDQFLSIQERISSLGGNLVIGVHPNNLVWQIDLDKNS